MSSMRSRKRPPLRRARSALSSAENAWPRCRYPFGLGAKRKVGVMVVPMRQGVFLYTMRTLKYPYPPRAVTMNHRLETQADVDAAVRALMKQDPRLKDVAAIAGRTLLRRRPGGFARLASIIVAQQL